MIYCHQFKRITSKEFLVVEPSKVIFDSSKRDKSPGLCKTRKLNFTVRIFCMVLFFVSLGIRHEFSQICIQDCRVTYNRLIFGKTNQRYIDTFIICKIRAFFSYNHMDRINGSVFRYCNLPIYWIRLITPFAAIFIHVRINLQKIEGIIISSSNRIIGKREIFRFSQNTISVCTF